MRILGIDPGTTTTGYAIIDKQGGDFDILDFGVFSTTPKVGLENKLLEIGVDIKCLIDKFKPKLVVVEKLFFQTNLKTGIDVAHARGVVIYECIKNNLNILEYTPLQVKKAITGNGKSNKAQLQKAIQIIFKLDSIPKPDDSADAIGLAYMGALNNSSPYATL